MKFPGGVGVLAAATITAVFTGPGQTIGVSVFIDHFVDSLGLDRSTVGFAYLVGTLSGAAALPAIGRFIDQRGVRLAQIIIGIAFALALVNMSLVNGAIWLTIGFVGIRLLGQGSLSLVSVVTVSTWYQENRGTAIGLYSTFSSSFMAAVPLALAVIIAAVGWRRAWLASALIVAAAVVPVAVFGLRQLPRRAGPLQHSSAAAAATGGHDRRQAITTRHFWLVAAMAAAASMLTTAMNFHQIDLLGSVGISSTAAAALFLPQVAGSAIAGVAFGWAADAIGTRYLPSIAAALLALTLVLGAIVAPGTLAVLYALALGIVGGAVATTGAALLPAWFGTTHLGSIQGMMQLVTVAASSVGPFVLALAEARIGYSAALLGLAVFPVAVTLFGLPRLPPLASSAAAGRSGNTMVNVEPDPT